MLDASDVQIHHGSVVPSEHDCPELSHTETVNLPVALVVGVHGLGVLMVGKGGV